MPDELFAHPRLAAIYDRLDGDRDDLGHYEAIVAELGATRILDVGCGTGTLALRLAALGHDVTGVDPAAASLDVARSKPGAEAVRWIEGDATTLPPGLDADLAVMTGNVAQVFTTDEEWAATLAGIHAALRPGGHLVFESRRPEARAWETWDLQHVRTAEVEARCRVLDVSEPLVTFRWTYRFTEGGPDDEVLHSDSTLRFRTEAEVRTTLREAGFAEPEVRDAPDRPGLEMVVVTHRPG
jgi:SAM-dependent methyltransferase